MLLDPKVVVGTALTAGAAVQSWIDTASPYAQLGVTVIGGVVGLATLYYTVQRIRALKRKENESTESDR